MDRYTLEIITLSNYEICEKINKITDPQRLTTICKAGQIKDCDTYKNADVIIINYTSALENINEILKNKADYTKIILINDGAKTVNKELVKFDLWENNDISLMHNISALKEKMLISLDLEFTKNQLYTLMDSVPDLIWYKDLNGLHIDVNKAFCKSIGKEVSDIKTKIKYLDQGQLMGLTAEEFAQGDFACVRTDNYVIEHQKTSLFDEKVLIHDEMRQFKTYKTALKGRKGETIGTVGMAHDVTDIWNTHEEFRIVISRLPFPMIILDKNYNLLSFNSKFGELFHYNEKNQADFNITSFGQKYFEFDISLCEFSNTIIEKEMHDEEKISHFIIEKSEVTDVFGELSGYFYVFRDITKTHNYEEQLRLMVETDELTQIYNRKFIREFFETKLRVFVKEKVSFAVAMIDIDYFKLYNDHYGHLEGDMVIKSIANILKNRSDNDKIFVARFGGEEFILMAIDKTEQEVKALISDIFQDLKQSQIPHVKSKVSDNLTMSIGVYYLQNLSNNIKLVDLIEIADKNLYEAKEKGRNCFISNI